jgi:hypothetical protein
MRQQTDQMAGVDAPRQSHSRARPDTGPPHPEQKLPHRLCWRLLLRNPMTARSGKPPPLAIYVANEQCPGVPMSLRSQQLRRPPGRRQTREPHDVANLRQRFHQGGQYLGLVAPMSRT